MNPGRRWRVVLAAAAGLCTATCAFAQQATPPGDIDQPQDSTEQGQTHLDQSFGPKSHDDWVRDTRRKAWEDTDWTVQLRSYYLDRDKYDDSESEAWALGGSAGLKTGYFRDRVAFGATVYGSAPLYAPDDKDGTTLLKPGQQGFAVLGEAYAEVLLADDVQMTVGARGFDTPYLNRNDSRMAPNTFLAAVVQGLHGDGERTAQWRWGAGYFDKIKERNSDEFVSMSTDAGADIKRGVYAAGLNYSLGDVSLGAVDYWSSNVINIFYTEAKYGFPLGEHATLEVAAQYSDQRSVGNHRLTGSAFDAHQWGLKADLAVAGALLTAGYTDARGDHDMTAPWSGYPGYTSVQVEDFNRAGEDAWLLRAQYTFPGHTGFSAYALHVAGSDPDAPSAHAQGETDFNVQWSPPDGPLQGLLVRLRYARVARDDRGDTDLQDLRVMVFYDLPL
ncbi:porin [Lysobacter helvus]|uniref:Porin n=2 Tax=Lysobacteraceae TaxID=32033 RepID=A0ABM7Q923_9GAMM|nr:MULTISPECIES: OprD family outer membrane porin [Lysobacter]BCT93936.1 porin [Lysobacter caseinilyticus]BCT97092.1 porin [Lysobacter helvus]